MTSVDEAEFHAKFRRDVWKASKSGAPPMRTLRYVDYLKTKDDRPSDPAALAMFGAGLGSGGKREVTRCGGSSPMIAASLGGGIGALVSRGVLEALPAVSGPLATGGGGFGGVRPPEATDDCPENIPCGTLPASFARSRGGGRFEIPDRTDWGSSGCVFEWGWSTCEAPQVNQSSSCPDLTSLSRFTFNGGSDAQRAVVKAAYRLLQQNLDLVRWVVCLVFGDRHIPNLQAVINFPERVELRFSSEQHSDNWLEPGHCAACDGNRAFACPWLITFCGTHELNERIWGEGWCCMKAEERLCITIDAATMIFHELCHVVGLQIDHTADTCDRLYLAESSLTWALLTRFPAARNDTCCSAVYGGEHLDPGTFMEESATTISLDCDVCDS